MPEIESESGYVPVDGARIYYQVAGDGVPLVMLHAGVADRRQWDDEFPYFARRYRVVRYDRRGFGKSEPVDGEFSHLDDLRALLEALGVDRPAVLMGCSMGGGLAMDFAAEHPDRVAALIMVASAPTGLWLDVPLSPLEEEADQAYEAGDLDRVAELHARMFFDGWDRTTEQVDPAMRRLMVEMDRQALDLQARGLGKHLPDAAVPAAQRLDELHVPLLIVFGEHDEPYIHAAAGYMAEHVPGAQKVMIWDAAHMLNMEQPGEFQRVVAEFLDGVLLTRAG